MRSSLPSGRGVRKRSGELHSGLGRDPPAQPPGRRKVDRRLVQHSATRRPAIGCHDTVGPSLVSNPVFGRRKGTPSAGKDRARVALTYLQPSITKVRTPSQQQFVRRIETVIHTRKNHCPIKRSTKSPLERGESAIGLYNGERVPILSLRGGCAGRRPSQRSPAQPVQARRPCA